MDITSLIYRIKNYKKHIDKYLYMTYNIDKDECEVRKMENKYSNIAKVFKALCDENRVRIIEMLSSGEKCACNILEELNITQPTLSHHMKILCDAGFVKCRKEGKWSHYSLSEEGKQHAIDILTELTNGNVKKFENNKCKCS